MEEIVENKSSIKKNKGKFIVLVMYFLVVLIGPLYFLTPLAQNQLVDIVHLAIPKDTDKFFMNYINLLHDDKIDEAYPLLSKETQKSISKDSIQQTLSKYFAHSTDQMEIVGGNFKDSYYKQQHIVNYDVTYEVKANDSVYPYIAVEIVAQDSGSGIKILGFRIIDEKESIKTQSQFNFSSQGIYLILSILIPLFIIYTAYRYIVKSKNPKWIPFLLILFTTLYIYISDENFKFTFGFSGFMSKSGPWGPWVFATPIPVGAIGYYFTRIKFPLQGQLNKLKSNLW